MDKHNLEGIDHPSEKKDDWKKFQKKYLKFQNKTQNMKNKLFF